MKRRRDQIRIFVETDGWSKLLPNRRKARPKMEHSQRWKGWNRATASPCRPRTNEACEKEECRGHGEHDTGSCVNKKQRARACVRADSRDTPRDTVGNIFSAAAASWPVYTAPGPCKISRVNPRQRNVISVAAMIDIVPREIALDRS